MVAAITRDRAMTPFMRAKAVSDRRRAMGRIAGGWVYDLAALGRAIALCNFCAPKFDAASVGYVVKRNIPFVRGRCDGCQEYVPQARLFLKADRLPR